MKNSSKLKVETFKSGCKLNCDQLVDMHNTQN